MSKLHNDLEKNSIKSKQKAYESDQTTEALNIYN
jgi:hypothetical protein